MKTKTRGKTFRHFWKGLAGICLSVSVFVLSATGFAEQAVTEQAKYVMPQEQVYLDPTQVEAAKKQLEDDASGNSGPRTKNVEVVTGDRVIAADVKVVEKPETEAAKNATVQPEKTETEKPAATVTQEDKEAKLLITFVFF